MKYFFKRLIVLITLNILVFSAYSQAGCATATYQFGNGDGCGTNQWNWGGTNVPSSFDGGNCMVYGTNGSNGCFFAIGGEYSQMTSFNCDFCYSFAYKADISGDTSPPITADGFTFSLVNMASNYNSRSFACNSTGCSDFSYGCGSGGFIGYNGLEFETMEETLLFEFDLHDNGGENPASCDAHLAIVEIDGTTDAVNTTQSSCLDSFNLEDGNYHGISICYDASATTITITIDGNTAATYNIDLSAYFTPSPCPGDAAPSVYPVFTSGWEPGNVAYICSITVLDANNANFSAKLVNSNVELSWVNSNKLDVLYEVERSADGINFSTITSTNSNLDASKYLFYDYNPQPGNNYYRLKEVELLSGLTTRSATQVVTLNNNSNFDINVSGNTVFVNVKSKAETDYYLNVYDINGKAMINEKYTSSSETQLKNLTNGMYIINLVSNGENITKKILILND